MRSWPWWRKAPQMRLPVTPQNLLNIMVHSNFPLQMYLFHPKLILWLGTETAPLINRVKPMGHCSRCCYRISLTVLPSTGKSRHDIHYLTSDGHSIAFFFFFFLNKINFECIMEHLKNVILTVIFTGILMNSKQSFLLAASLRFLHCPLFPLIALRKNILLQGKRWRKEISTCT